MTSAFDRWLTTEPEWRTGEPVADEYDPPCPTCGQPCSDHLAEQVTDEATGIDYEATVCPPALDGFTKSA